MGRAGLSKRCAASEFGAIFLSAIRCPLLTSDEQAAAGLQPLRARSLAITPAAPICKDTGPCVARDQDEAEPHKLLEAEGFDEASGDICIIRLVVAPVAPEDGQLLRNRTPFDYLEWAAVFPERLRL